MFVAGLLWSFVAPASAQTGPALLIKPWPDKGQVFDGYADAYLFEAGHTKNTNNSYRLEDYEAVGRFRILPGNEISPRIGYDFLFLDNHTNHPGIPNQLSDESLAIGTGIARWKGWVAGITLGGGYAGAGAFGQGRGWYGKADLVVAYDLNATDTIGIILDVDTHRPYLPDTPLPGAGYSHRFDPKLQMVAGMPYSSLDWKPFEHVDVKGEYNLFSDLRASIGYEFIPHWTVYGTCGYVRNLFRIDGLPERKHLLYYQRRAEIGVRFTPCENVNFKAGIGYGWDGSYRSGWDFRKSQQIADISDVPYLRMGLEMKF